MTYVVVDTDVASAILKGQLPDGPAHRLTLDDVHGVMRTLRASRSAMAR